MRIRDIGSHASDKLLYSRSERLLSNTLENTKGKSFGDTLSDTHQSALNDKLISILGKIDEQGDRLATNLSISELLRYKRLIIDFLNEAIPNIYMVFRHNNFAKDGGHNLHCIVQTVDRRLESLTEQILEKEQDKLAILEHIDEVKGLLMDIMM